MNRVKKEKGVIRITRESFNILYRNVGFKNSGLTLEFRFLVGIGRSGVMIGRVCLNMVS